MAALEKLATRIAGSALFFLVRLLIRVTRQNKSRMHVLDQLASSLGTALERFDNPYTVSASRDLQSAGGFVVMNEGVKIIGRAAERNLKAQGNSRLEGFDIIEELASSGIKKPSTIVDIGANFGEISLCFAQRFPKARIIAVEPVSSNIAVMEENLAVQDFDTSNIELVKLAVSDKLEEVRITNHLGSQNSIVAKRNLSHNRYETVACKSIDQIFSDAGIDQCDFLKIDIEGAEPDVREGLARVLPCVSIVQLEFSYKNTPENYAKLVEVFAAAKDQWACFDKDDLASEIPLDQVMQDFAQVTGRKPCRNYWFVKQP
ncbi:MAG: FkbM family methyltransferase [Pseudomonadota bacterium]